MSNNDRRNEFASDRSHFTKRNEAASRLVTKYQTYASKTLNQSQPTDGHETRMVAERDWQPVKRDSTAQVVNVMHAYVGSEPAQNNRQVVVRASVECGLNEVPIPAFGPRRVFELVLDKEQPHPNGTSDEGNREVDE